MLPILQIGPLALQAPGLFFLIALWIGVTLTEKSAKLYKISSETISNLLLISMVAGVLGARLAYLARFPEAFAGNLGSLFSLNPGLLDLSGGIAAAVIVALIYGQRKELKLWQSLDALVPFFGMLAIGIALSNAASGNAFGMKSDLPWAIELWGAKRHPSQIYELLAAFATLNLLYPPKQNAQPVAGRSFLTFVAFTAGYKLFLEAFRGDSALIFNGIRSTQVVALIVLAAALWLLDKKSASVTNK